MNDLTEYLEEHPSASDLLTKDYKTISEEELEDEFEYLTRLEKLVREGKIKNTDQLNHILQLLLNHYKSATGKKHYLERE